MNLPTIDFMGKRQVAGAISVALVVLSFVWLVFVDGLNRGLDFTGGTLVEVEFEEPMDPERVRGILDAAGYQNGVVQYFGTERDLLIRMPPQLDIMLNSRLEVIHPPPLENRPHFESPKPP